MEIRRNWSCRYLNAPIISVCFELVTNFYRAGMFKSKMRKRKLDISLKMNFKPSATVGHIRATLEHSLISDKKKWSRIS